MMALILGPGGIHTITIIDYSRDGLRLEGATGVAVGERITVQLLTGDRLPLAVAWAFDDKIGAEFLGPIRPDHPAMIALDQAAQRQKLLHPLSVDTFPPDLA